MRTITLCLMMLALQLTSCDTDRIYEKNIELPKKLWLADSAIHFEFKLASSQKRYNLYYNIRNTRSYPFQNIYVRYNLNDTLGNLVSKELINQDLFDPKTGKPYGSGLGDIFDHQFTILKNHKFDQVGVYQFSLQHYMRPDTLKEIISVGMRLEEAQEISE
ncbi:gliding motility lipoprotein GldH [Fulvivirga sp. M361]|uniref:gliding motility lipoprotein GldH n=1 Tax=Fulvivirga sp. M361 TaxID=2594266 RepID=UPI00117BD7F8|nr:gliding motility lipoprotein GldH [Fulvivirga sp. M361]TRX53702.1 gliding motility lipoprotein GldH [Fulvivirga sp. M361]